MTNARLDFISREIPIFHYFHFKELTAFKGFFWANIMWELPQYKDKKKFSLANVQEIHRYRETIIQHYMDLPGIEVWGFNNLSITFNQIWH